MTRKGQTKRTTSEPQHIKPNQQELDEFVDKLLRIGTLPNETNLTKALVYQREIKLITDKIQSLEMQIKSSEKYATDNGPVVNRTDAATIGNFTKWVTDNGAELNGCSITFFEDYELGLKVNTDIPTSSLVIAVPRNLMLTVENASLGDFSELLEKDQILNNMPNVALAMYLLYIKFKKDPFWKPFFDILPTSYSTVLYFSVEELEELKGSPTLELALKQIKSIARQYAYFYKLFRTSQDRVSKLMRKHFTYSEYCWAVSTVMTRQNTILSEDGGRMINALIPLWDMCNHNNGKISTDYNPDLQRSECLALKDFKQGEQFFIFYGARTNADFFIHNGFVYEDNIHDGYWMKMGIGKADHLKEKRIELLKKLNLLPNSEYFIDRSAEPADGQLLSFLRVFNMPEAQLDKWLESEDIKELRQVEYSGFDPALERKSWTFLRNRLQLLLGLYATTLEHDTKILQEESTMSANRRLAIRLRTTEKKILTTVMEYSNQRISLNV